MARVDLPTFRIEPGTHRTALTSTGKLTVSLAYTKGSNNFFKEGDAAKSENTAAVGHGIMTISYAWTF